MVSRVKTLFLPRDATHKRGLCHSAASVSPGVYHVRVFVEASKCILNFFHSRVASHTILPNLMAIFQRGPPTWAKIALYNQYLALASITARILACRQHLDGESIGYSVYASSVSIPRSTNAAALHVSDSES